MFGELESEELMDEELKPLLGEPPSISAVPVLEEVKQHAIADPASIRQFIERKAKELAIAAGCSHVEPLVMWKDDPHAAETCGQFQAHVLSAVDMHVRMHFLEPVGQPLAECVWSVDIPTQPIFKCQCFFGQQRPGDPR